MKCKTIIKLFSIITLIKLIVPFTHAQLFISQYYEGESNDKWIELWNGGEEAINLETGSFYIGLWRNADSEGYKTNIAPSNTLALTGIMDSGTTLLISHSEAAAPGYALADVATGGLANFNGNDSLALYTGEVFATNNIIDAIGFTETGNEGQNTSFVRLSTDPGYNTEAGSQVEDFSSVWNKVLIETVNNATIDQDERLGEVGSLALLPEPSMYTIALTSLVLGVGIRRRYIRRRHSSSLCD